MFCTYSLGDKPQFQHPAWYTPAGGGVFGNDAGAPIYNNGWPSQDAILRLARPIIIPVRQNISVELTFFAMGTTNVLTLLNSPQTDDQLNIMYMIDGLQTRDVQ